MNFQFGKGLGFVNSFMAEKASETIAAPLVQLKRNVERIMEDYAAPLSEVTFKGFNHHGQYDPAEQTDVDKTKLEEAKGLVKKIWDNRMNPKSGFKEIVKPDGYNPNGDVRCFMMYDEKERYGLSLAHCIVNATPKQCMGYYADRRNASSFNDEVDIVATSYTTALELLLIKSPVPTVSDREALFRTCFFRETDRTETDSYFKVGYTMEDERRPAKKGRVRMDTLFLVVAKELGGSEGTRSEVWRFNRTDPKFGKGLGVLNAIVADKASMYNAAPLAGLKADVERLVEEYEPPLVEEDGKEQRLTWKGHLWRYARTAWGGGKRGLLTPRIAAGWPWRQHSACSTCTTPGTTATEGLDTTEPPAWRRRKRRGGGSAWCTGT
jgi:hypothetical protein